MKEYIRIHANDVVAVALKDLEPGTEIVIDGMNPFPLNEKITKGHKFALTDLAAGTPVIKYGMPIGNLTEDVKQGQTVHTHNVKTGLSDIVSYTYNKEEIPAKQAPGRSFQGYRRPDGRVGVRNEIWIIPTVGCVNNIIERVAKSASHLIDGSLENIVAFPHPYGCSQMGDDQELTRLALAALAKHPNCGGVLLMGLGCENSNIPIMGEYLDGIDEKKIRYLVAQNVEDEYEAALELLEELAEYVKTFEREEVDASELVIGLKCGGSDGLSGITANPLVGYFSDYVVHRGGTTILTEVPEMFGAEQILMNRAADASIYEDTVRLVNDFKQYFIDHDQEIYENPSPGNKAGGITTLEDKSLGCIQKAGHSEVKGVLQYAEPVQSKGLNLLQAPGNDLVSSTALALSGAQIVLFTTGRGTPFASPVPTVKISSNSQIFEKKGNWIDFNAGELLEEDVTMEQLGEAFADYIFLVASGEQVNAEKNGYHDMAIFKMGVTL